MRRTKEEIDEELSHQRTIIRALNSRRRPLEMQAAQKGINTPPEVLTELSSLLDQIRVHEEELTRLETLAVEDRLELTEVEYQLKVAEAWNESRPPSVVQMVRLELERLRLGMTLERAKEIEYNIRVKFVEQDFTSQLEPQAWPDKIHFGYITEPETTIRLIKENLLQSDVDSFKDFLSREKTKPRRFFVTKKERDKYMQFINKLEEYIDIMSPKNSE